MFTNYIHFFYIQKIYTFCIPNFIYTDIRIYPKYPNLSKNIQTLSKNIRIIYYHIWNKIIKHLYFTTVFLKKKFIFLDKKFYNFKKTLKICKK